MKVELGAPGPAGDSLGGEPKLKPGPPGGLLVGGACGAGKPAGAGDEPKLG